ncbi:MAG: hypothetical protein HZB25_04760 [Candidatus Eisenbacteria bacterium]|nr:hypothetical protein [Candidatus Eisenbacteria bacterium]
MRPLFILLALFSLNLAPAPPAACGARDIETMRGVTLSLFHPLDRERTAASLDRIRALGATHVSVIVPFQQEDVASLQIGLPPEQAVPDTLLLRVAAEAHARGLKVVVFPLLSVRQHGPGLWRGALRPPSWRGWFRAYGERLLHCAQVAREARAEWFCVGAELVTSEAHAQLWRDLIRRVRAAYPGRLMYSQNWDRPGRLGFGDQLDLVGMNAYFELTAPDTPAPQRGLRERWVNLRRDLERNRVGRGPLVFTELGYPSSERAATRPWDHVAPREARPDLQKTCFEAFFRAWSGSSRLRGAFVYLWSAQEGGEGDSGYSIRDKPAEATVGSWFRSGFPGGSAPVEVGSGSGGAPGAPGRP